MKIKTITDGILACIMFIVVACATQGPVVESPPGKYQIYQKDDRGVVVAVYTTDRFTEVIGKEVVLSFVDSSGKPRTFKSYDIRKL